MLKKIAQAPRVFQNRRARPHIRLGNAARDTGRWAEAAASYAKALSWTPRRADIWIQYGHMLKETGRLDEADVAYHRAIVLQPDDADAHLHLGHLRKVQGRLEEAEQAYREAEGLDDEMSLLIPGRDEGGRVVEQSIAISRRGFASVEPRKYNGTYTREKLFSVVSAAYNVGRYVDEFIASIVNQDIGFVGFIQLIIVDDGSSDDTSERAKRWQNLYPDNIVYIHQDNRGQAAARNVGMYNATGEWISFADPDDILSINYFSEIKKQLELNAGANLCLVSARVAYYREDSCEVSYRHPLDRRFDRAVSVVPVDNNSGHIQMSASTAIFNRAALSSANISFDPNVRPAFEDTLFTNAYLCRCVANNILFLRDIVYLYRKRADRSSTLDNSWNDIRRFREQIVNGTLGILSHAKSTVGRLPVFIQQVVLYELSFTIRELVENPNSSNFLTSDDRQAYFTHLKSAIGSLDKDVLIDFVLSRFPYGYKVGVHFLAFGVEVDNPLAYIFDYDRAKCLVAVRYYSGQGDVEAVFRSPDGIIVPAFRKSRSLKILDRHLVWENVAWLPIPAPRQISMDLMGVGCRFVLAGRQIGRMARVNDIRASFNPQPKAARDIGAASAGKWLFMDRDVNGDDNAEHLYRYVRQHAPRVRASYVIRKSSCDWHRLSAEGFDLIPFGTSEHIEALSECRNLISSHLDDYVFQDRSVIDRNGSRPYNFTFLQHGVIQNDLSQWVNRKKIDCFVTSSKREYGSIVEGSEYVYSPKEVVLAGLARHDRLRSLASHGSSRTIVIAPTWRREVVGPVVGEGNKRDINPEFSSTIYARSWKAFIHSEALKNAHDKFGFTIIFHPHENILPYLEQFDLPKHVMLFGGGESSSIQNLLASSRMMITDYSSVAFEMAALDRTVLYFQFDLENLNDGSHIFRPGYYDYRSDGFGPVCNELSELELALESALERDGQPEEIYLQRMKNTFAYHDQDNCRRIVEAIEVLDASDFPVERKLPAWTETARRAAAAQQWDVALEAWRMVHEAAPEASVESSLGMVEALRSLGRSQEAADWLERAVRLGAPDAMAGVERFALSAFAPVDLEAAYAALPSALRDVMPDSMLVFVARTARMRGDLAEASRWLDRCGADDGVAVRGERAWIASAARAWDQAQALWRGLIGRHVDAPPRLAEALREAGEPAAAEAMLAAGLSGAVRRDWWEQGVENALALENWTAALQRLDRLKAFGEMEGRFLAAQSRALRASGRYKEARAVLEASRPAFSSALCEEDARLAAAEGDWAAAVMAWDDLLTDGKSIPRDAWLRRSEALSELGLIEDAVQSIAQHENVSGICRQSRRLKLELQGRSAGLDRLVLRSVVKKSGATKIDAA